MAPGKSVPGKSASGKSANPGPLAFWESHDSADYVDWSRARSTSFPNLRQNPQSNPEKQPPTPE